MSNINNVSKAVVAIIASEEAGKSGPFDLVARYKEDMLTLRDKIAHGSIHGVSERATILDFFGSQPDGEKLLEASASLKGKGKSKSDKLKQAALDMRIKSVVALLSRTATVMDVLARLEKESFVIRFKSSGTNRIVALVHGPDDDSDDAKPMSVENVRAIAERNFANVRKVEDISTKRAKSANVSKGNAGERIAPSKLRDAVNSIDTTFAAFDLGAKDNGLPPGAVMSAALLWARLDAELSADIKAKARQQYDAEADDAANAAKTA
jgi:GGDEF domain-containing protein